MLFARRYGTAIVLLLLVAAGSAASLSAQAQRPAARTTTLRIAVTDGKGTPLSGVRVRAIGPADREATSGADGAVDFTGVRAGTYRLRAEAEDWVTFEREVTVPPRTPSLQIDLTLSPAPPRPTAPAPESAATSEDRPRGELSVTALADFADRNLVGRNEPQKLTVFGCTGHATTRLLQINEPLDRRLEDADESLYVMAGEGTLTADGSSRAIGAGTLTVIPRGTSATLARKSRGPLILVSVVSGPPCRP